MNCLTDVDENWKVGQIDALSRDVIKQSVYRINYPINYHILYILTCIIRRGEGIGPKEFDNDWFVSLESKEWQLL